VKMLKQLNEVYPFLNFIPSHASGSYIYSEDGRKILDMYGGHAVTSLGYGNEQFSDFLSKQIKDLIFQSNAVNLPIREEASKKLISLAPDSVDKVFFVNSGAEANENALKIALKISNDRKKVISLKHAFHGRTAAAAAVTWGNEKWYGFPNKPMDVEFIERDSMEGLHRIDKDVAAVIIEPVQGIGGAYAFDQSYISALEQKCKDHKVFLIADEVQCGMARCGEVFCSNLYKIKPDMITLAKGLGGGVPVGAVLVSKEIASSLGPGDLGSTFGGGPLASAAVSFVTDTIQDKSFLKNISRVSALLMKGCLLPPITQVQGKGLLIGLVSDFAGEIKARLLDKNILVGSSSFKNTIRLLPPLTLSVEEVELFIETLKEVCHEIS
jgi:acetylornithine/N-succinyldiaminopimelate aminotransferase